MAIDFAAASSEYYVPATFIDDTLTTYSVMGWCHFSDNGATQTIWAARETGVGSKGLLFRLSNSGISDRLIFSCRDNANNSATAAGTTSSFPYDQWNFGMCVRDGNNTTIILNDFADEGNGSNTLGTISTGYEAIGATAGGDGSYTSFADGAIAELAAWNVALTDPEISILAKGFSPLFVRPQNLISYRPFISLGSDQIDRVATNALTKAGTPTTFASHPRIIYPSSYLIHKPIPRRSFGYIVG